MFCYDTDMSELTRQQYVHPLVRCPRCNTAYYHISQSVDVICDQCAGAAINALCFEDGLSLALNETYRSLWDGGHYRALSVMLLSLRGKVASPYWQSEINHRLRRVYDKLDVLLDLGDLMVSNALDTVEDSMFEVADAIATSVLSQGSEFERVDNSETGWIDLLWKIQIDNGERDYYSILFVLNGRE